MKIILNGQLIDELDPQLPSTVFNPLEQSVFETFILADGRVPGTLKQHWERLFSSAKVLGFDVPPTLTQARLDESLLALMATLDFGNTYRCKVLVEAGYWFIRAMVVEPLSAEIYNQGVEVGEAVEVRENPLAKWSSPLYQRYFDIQAQGGVFETLFFDKTDHLLEGNITNVIAVINGVLVSPAENVLPGITVREVFARAAVLGFKTEFRSVRRAELKTASEIFLTNAVKGLVPVTKWHDWRRSEVIVYEQLRAQ